MFNAIEKAWELTWPTFWSKESRHKAIRKIVQVEELICRHHKWWEGDTENIDGYAPGFRAYILFVLDKCRKEKRL